MAQPSVACYFTNRKRSAVEDIKINRAKKILLIDPDSQEQNETHFVETQPEINSSATDQCQIVNIKSDLSSNKIVLNLAVKSDKKILKPRSKKTKNASNCKDIQQLLGNMNRKREIIEEGSQTIVESSESIREHPGHVTPPRSPKKSVNAMDKVSGNVPGPSIKEIRKKMTRSARLAELKASISRFQDGDAKLKEIEKKTSSIPDSPKLKCFKTIELEVQTSPLKVFSPEKSYLSPKKDSSVRRNLVNLFSPTKNAVAALPASPSKAVLEETSKPALTLPYKYRYLAEMFRSIDTVSQILYNRKENITFRKVKPAVEEMLKRNLTEKHLAQIRSVFPDAFGYRQEKLKVFGEGVKQERWELVLIPNLENNDQMNSDLLLKRRRKLFNLLLDKVKDYHAEFLSSLEPPIAIAKDKITRWHPEFDIERVPDVEPGDLPQPPVEEKFTTGKDVLERARKMFNCNTRMEFALNRLKEAREANALPIEEKKVEEPKNPVLKGIPKSLLEKVRQKQAAKALVSMTRSESDEKQLKVYSRLPELARLVRNLFVSEKKSVLPLEALVDKLENCYRANLTRKEMKEHVEVLAKEAPKWLVIHDVRKCLYVKLAKNDDVSLVVRRLETIVQEMSEK